MTTNEPQKENTIVEREIQPNEVNRIIKRLEKQQKYDRVRAVLRRLYDSNTAYGRHYLDVEFITPEGNEFLIMVGYGIRESPALRKVKNYRFFVTE